MTKVFLAVITLLLVGCTDARMSKLTNLGNSAKIKCYSGGMVIYDGESTGKVKSEETSDGYFFKEKGTGRLLEVSGNCIISYD